MRSIREKLTNIPDEVPTPEKPVEEEKPDIKEPEKVKEKQVLQEKETPKEGVPQKEEEKPTPKEVKTKEPPKNVRAEEEVKKLTNEELRELSSKDVEGVRKALDKIAEKLLSNKNSLVSDTLRSYRLAYGILLVSSREKAQAFEKQLNEKLKQLGFPITIKFSGEKFSEKLIEHLYYLLEQSYQYVLSEPVISEKELREISIDDLKFFSLISFLETSLRDLPGDPRAKHTRAIIENNLPEVKIEFNKEFAAEFLDNVKKTLKMSEDVVKKLPQVESPEKMFENPEVISTIRELFKIEETAFSSKTKDIISSLLKPEGASLTNAENIRKFVKALHAVEREEGEDPNIIIWQNRSLNNLYDIGYYKVSGAEDLFVEFDEEKLTSFVKSLEKRGIKIPKQVLDNYKRVKLLSESLERGIVASVIDNITSNDLLVKSLDANLKSVLGELAGFNLVNINQPGFTRSVAEMYKRVTSDWNKESSKLKDNLSIYSIQLKTMLLKDNFAKEVLKTKLPINLSAVTLAVFEKERDNFEKNPELKEKAAKNIEDIVEGRVSIEEAIRNSENLIYDIVATNAVLLRESLKAFTENKDKELCKELFKKALKDSIPSKDLDKEEVIDYFVSSMVEEGVPPIMFEMTTSKDKGLFGKVFVKVGKRFISEDEFNKFARRFLESMDNIIHSLSVLTSISDKEKVDLRRNMLTYLKGFRVLYGAVLMRDPSLIEQVGEARRRIITSFTEMYKILAAKSDKNKALLAKLENLRWNTLDKLEKLNFGCFLSELNGYGVSMELARSLGNIMIGALMSVSDTISSGGEEYEDFKTLLSQIDNYVKSFDYYNKFLSDIIQLGMAYDAPIVGALNSGKKSSSIRVKLAKVAAVEGGLTLENLIETLSSFAYENKSLPHYYLLQKALRGLYFVELVKNGGISYGGKLLDNLKENPLYTLFVTLQFTLNKL